MIRSREGESGLALTSPATDVAAKIASKLMAISILRVIGFPLFGDIRWVIYGTGVYGNRLFRDMPVPCLGLEPDIPVFPRVYREADAPPLAFWLRGVASCGRFYRLWG